MAKLDLMQFAVAEVPEGETAMGVVKANWNGQVAPTPLATGGIASLGQSEFAPHLQGPPDDAILPPPNPDAIVQFPSARQMVIVLTEYRLLVWSLGFSGKPKDYIGDVPLTAITGIQFGAGGFGNILRISMASTAEVDVEIMRGEPAEAFANELARRIPRPDQGAVEPPAGWIDDVPGDPTSGWNDQPGDPTAG